jgi:hypothetical protein
MRKPVVNHHKAHMSLRDQPSARMAACGCPRPPRVPLRAVPYAERPAAWPSAGLAFAAVRPGFVAACIVEAVAEAGAGPVAPAARTVPRAGRAGRAAGRRRPGAASESSRRLRQRGGSGSRATGDGYPRRAQRNGQIEHFYQVAARLRKGVRCGAAITPRERADALDLLLTTLSSEPCVQSSIFGFVMT